MQLEVLVTYEIGVYCICRRKWQNVAKMLSGQEEIMWSIIVILMEDDGFLL